MHLFQSECHHKSAAIQKSEAMGGGKAIRSWISNLGAQPVLRCEWNGLIAQSHDQRNFALISVL